MLKRIDETRCPKCFGPSMKSWNDLDRDQKMVVERHPGLAAIPKSERPKRRYCMRCLTSDDGPRRGIA